MNEYRCTRNQPYTNNPKCLGYTNLEARSGYYLKSADEQGAIAQMKEQFPLNDAGFTADLWKIDCPACKGLSYQKKPYSLNVRRSSRVSCELCRGWLQVEVDCT